jgi:hypothetical protein
MARTQYFVVYHEKQWKIKLNDKHFGPYLTQQIAIKEAVETANREGKRNSDGAQVLVQGLNNQWRTEWTYGKDPFPPKG